MTIKNKTFKLIAILLYAIIAIAFAYIILDIMYEMGGEWVAYKHTKGLPYPEWRGFCYYTRYISVFLMWLQSWLMLCGIGHIFGKQYAFFNDCSGFKSFFPVFVIPALQAVLEFIIAWIILCVVKGGA